MSEDNIKASEIVSTFLGVKCTLVKSMNSTKFVNQSECLLVNRDSFNQVESWISEQKNKTSISIGCFRGNIIAKSLSGNTSFNEDQWTSFKTGFLEFQVMNLYVDSIM